MTHNVKSELRRSMDAIHFSGDDKERMVALLMSAEAPEREKAPAAGSGGHAGGGRAYRRGGIHPLVKKRSDGL